MNRSVKYLLIVLLGITEANLSLLSNHNKLIMFFSCINNIINHKFKTNCLKNSFSIVYYSTLV